MVSPQRIRVDPEKCTGCRICELICAFSKYSEFNPKRSRIRIVKMERFFVDVPVVCKQCLNPLCVKDCPVGALKKGTDSTINVDEELCTGCERCIGACPFGAISIDPLNRRAIVCDLCAGSPECVQWCPTKALQCRPIHSTSQRKRWNAVASTVQTLLEKWGIRSKEYEEYFEKLEGPKIKTDKRHSNE